MANEICFKPITPALREEVISSLDEEINFLMSCSDEMLADCRIFNLEQVKRYINELPDGHPIII